MHHSLLPLRFLCIPDVVLIVISKGSERTESVDIPMPALESLSPEIEIFKKSIRHDPRRRDRETLTKAQLSQKELEASMALLMYSTSLMRVDILSGTPLKALTTLAYSDNMNFQKTAARTFAAEVVKGGGSVQRDVMEPVLYMLRSYEIVVHEPTLYALANLVFRDEKNRKLAVELGALEDLNRLIRAAAPDVHCIALYAVNEITQTESLRVDVANSGVLDQLVSLSQSKDARVPPQVASTFLEFSYTSETRQMIVEAGAIPVLIQFLDSIDPDVQHFSADALTRIADDDAYQRMVVEAHEGLASTLVGLLDPFKPHVSSPVAQLLSRLVLAQDFRAKILQTRVLTLLSQMMRSNSYQLIRSSMRLFYALYNGLPIGSTNVEAALTDRIVELVLCKGNSDVQYEAVMTLFALSHNEENARAIVKAGALDHVRALVSQANLQIQSEMARFIYKLTFFESLRPQLDRSGLFEVLIPLSLSSQEEVWTPSAGAILEMIDTKDHISIARVWNAPTGGLRKCFIHFLRSNNGTLQHLTIRAIFGWLEHEDIAMKTLIAGSPEIVTRVKEIANDPEAYAPIRLQRETDATGVNPDAIALAQASLIIEALAVMMEE
ncbi:Vacuolar protein 8 [Dissophora globulifera]|uniref:Vacuolar protein 8 n=1 Tax=Dissophora globulifera TaxID=979702 RepID=A0A9P6UY31_9FUNG|nr:Vacuolar protein 8 [Dissophora globulifera]